MEQNLKVGDQFAVPSSLPVRYYEDATDAIATAARTLEFTPGAGPQVVGYVQDKGFITYSPVEPVHEAQAEILVLRPRVWFGLTEDGWEVIECVLRAQAAKLAS